jgi:hypothetical protein
MLRTPILTCSATNFVKALQRDPIDTAGFLKQLRLKKVRLLVHGVAGEQQRAKVKAAGVDFLAAG